MIVAYQLSCFDPNNRTYGMIEIAQQEPNVVHMCVDLNFPVLSLSPFVYSFRLGTSNGPCKNFEFRSNSYF